MPFWMPAPLDCGLGGEKPVSLVSIQAFVDKCPYAIKSMKMPFIPLHLAIFRGEKAPEIKQIIKDNPNSVANYGTPNLSHLFSSRCKREIILILRSSIF